MLSAVGVIPARYGSSRLPGKPLADLQGKPLLYHVYRRASQSQTLKKVVIATDDERIFSAALEFGAEAVMTSPGHRSGTDRIAEVAQKEEANIIVNIQGDEPLIDYSAIDQAVNMLHRDPEADMATLKSLIQEPDDLWNPNIVKVVTDQNDYAVYFSRSPIPYSRVKEMPGADLRDILASRPELLENYFRHVGLYAYRREFLLHFAAWEATPLELLEDLEQLRALGYGAKIKVEVSYASTLGIDTPEDLERIRKLVSNNPKLLEV